MERNLIKILQTHTNITRFGLVWGLFSAIYKISKLAIKKLNLKLTNQQANFISGMLCTSAFMFATKAEIKMIKLLVFPRVIECIYHILCDKGYCVRFKHGDILAYAFQVSFITYCFIFEQQYQTAGFMRTID